MKTYFLALAFAVTWVASGVSHAQIISVQSGPHPQTGAVAMLAMLTSEAVFSGTSNVITFSSFGDASITYRLHGCAVGSAGGTIDNYHNRAFEFSSTWITKGNRIIDTFAVKVCQAAIDNAAAVAPLRKYLDGSK